MKTNLLNSVKKFIVAVGFFLMAAIYSGVGYANDFILIGHSDVVETALSKSDVEAIYMGQNSTWPSGLAVKPCQLKNKNKTTKSFFKAVGVNAKKFKRYWRKQLFSGNGVPPSVIGSDDDMVSFVEENEGAIGFVKAGTDVSSVKTIAVQ